MGFLSDKVSSRGTFVVESDNAYPWDDSKKEYGVLLL